LDHLQILFRVGAVGSLTDGELIDRFLSGSEDVAEAAFTALVDRHGALVLHACREVLGNSEDANDAFQATFLILLKRAGAIRKQNSVASWLYGVARRVSLRSKSESARRRAHERKKAERAVERERPDEVESGSDGWHELHEEIARLPDRFREPMILHYFEGLSAEAAAQRLACARGTILSRLARGRERLRGRLVQRGVTHAIAVLPVSTPFVLPPVPASLASVTIRATGVKTFPVSITSLAEGVLRTMMIKKLTVILAACVIGGGLGIGGLDLLARSQAPIQTSTNAREAAKPATDSTPKTKAEPTRSDLARERLGEYVGIGGGITHPAVHALRKGLGITTEQFDVAKKLADERDPKRILVMKQIPAGMEGEALQQLMKDLNAAIDRDAGDAIAKMLRPGQLARLDQIVLTGHGVRALGYADIQEKLHLTAEQKEKIDSIIAKHHEQLRAISRRPGGLPQNAEGQMALEEELEPLRRKAFNDALAVLTPEQTTIWHGLVGKPFVAGEEPPK